MTVSKPMTSVQLNELMTVAVNMQRDSEKAGDHPSAVFAYAVQVAVLELRKVRNHAAKIPETSMSIARYWISPNGIACEDNEGKFVRYEDYTALEARCAALAAENAGLKSAAKETLAHWAAAEPGEMEKMMDKCMPALRVAYCETTSTDAILAEVRAQGVDALVERRLTAARLAKEAGHEITARDLEGEAIRARFFAMEIRKGVQS